MKTLQDALDDLNREQAEARAKLETEYAILSHFVTLAEGYNPPTVHPYKLYGAMGSVHFGYCRYASISEGKNPDRELFRRLLAAFPPALPLVRVKDGCTSFRPDLPENNVKGQLYDCGPVKIDIKVFQGPDASFEWHANINGELWRIEIEFPLHQCTLGSLNARARYVGEIVTSWDVCEFRADAPAQVQKWASGGKEYPNHFTLFYDRDSGYTMDYPSLVKK